jgi:hypothetical protein
MEKKGKAFNAPFCAEQILVENVPSRYNEKILPMHYERER